MAVLKALVDPAITIVKIRLGNPRRPYGRFLNLCGYMQYPVAFAPC